MEKETVLPEKGKFKITIEIDWTQYPNNNNVTLTNSNGDTFTSDSEGFIDFFYNEKEVSLSELTPEAKDYTLNNGHYNTVMGSGELVDETPIVPTDEEISTEAQKYTVDDIHDSISRTGGFVVGAK